MPRISNSKFVLYACIGMGSSILVEFSRDQTDIPPLALKCIELTPLHHSMFSQTRRGRTYTFLIDDPLVYFGIFDDALSKSEGLHFLGKVKAGYLELIKNGLIKNSSDQGTSSCLQAHFDVILRGLMQSDSDMELVSSPGCNEKKPPGRESPNGGGNFTAHVMGSPRQGLKKKRRFNGEVVSGGGSEVIIIKDNNLENKVDACYEMNGLVPKNISCLGMDRQKARQVWKKQVWVVLLLDLFVCASLFGIWLWFCWGFQCIDA